MNTSLLLLPFLWLSLLIFGFSAPALPPGNLLKETARQDQGDTDLYPLYECGKTGAGVPITSWYGACRSSCSIASNSTEVVLEVFYRNDSVGYIDMLSIRTTEIVKKSHVSWYGECNKETTIHKTVLAPEHIIEDSIDILYDGLTDWGYGADIHVHDTIDFPPCEYVDDKYNRGWRFIITKRTIELKSDIAGDGYIIDPDLGYIYPVTEGIGRGKFWHVWKPSSVPSGGCYFKSAGKGNCTLLMDTFTYSCPTLNVAFSAKVENRLTDTCIGDANISTDGVTYKMASQQSAGSISSALVGLWHQTQEAVIQQLILLINDALGKIESSYCESTCDITESVFYGSTERSSVVETPVGPWLPSVDKGKVTILPCQGDLNLVVITPIEMCYDPFMLRVKSMKTLDMFWWKPSESHVTSSTVCKTVSEEELAFRGELKKPLVMEFWRGAFVLEYPYNGSGTWINNPGGHVHRSSKWFPVITELSYSVPITLPKLTKEIRKHVQDTVVSVGGFTNTTSYPITEGIWSILTTISIQVTRVSAKILDWWIHLEEEVKNWLKIGFLVLLSLFIGIWGVKALYPSKERYVAVGNEINWVPSKS